MTRYKAVIQYDGSGFLGYQIQATGRTVQEEIQKALTKMHKGQKTVVNASGRTDTGVHAKGQVIHWDSPFSIPVEGYYRGLETLTPDDIAIVSVEEVAADFHARYDVSGKEYRYFVKRSPQHDPFSRHYALRYPFDLDESLMNQAARILEGEHDFTSFCSARTDRESKVRDLYAIKIMPTEDGWIFSFSGSGFLYNMVRILVGALLYVGQKKLTPSEIKVALDKKDRTALVSRTAPPQALYLWEVFYEKDNKK
ncbi:tRNA pseudouridine(38-40) synthase TruA [Brochothrix thermosphacta]|uniref:tRNA pseudouridine(38-40) synthase TruA n=1 Tax=Brochothrix thermosphacta TaxID=2756 RepID=UPI002713225C|nr:tRNA pseudouridine(38-40) synthase TruA [Brochothrix thermosphacta]MDO7865111.1 tRNA pseudouridine(38-40) synthase TruA [Brochothrix thermosphacta]